MICLSYFEIFLKELNKSAKKISEYFWIKKLFTWLHKVDFLFIGFEKYPPFFKLYE